VWWWAWCKSVNRLTISQFSIQIKASVLSGDLFCVKTSDFVNFATMVAITKHIEIAIAVSKGSCFPVSEISPNR